MGHLAAQGPLAHPATATSTPAKKAAPAKSTPKSAKSALAKFLEDSGLMALDQEDLGAAVEPQLSGNKQGLPRRP